MENITNNNLVGNLPEERGWEYKQICVTRVPGYGFGIAVSGGRDNPHFASGDPSIAVSDVLASGPAERILQVNDRIISVNGISLHNVDYATAVQVLRDSGDTVTLVVKRRTAYHQHSHSLSNTATANVGIGSGSGGGGALSTTLGLLQTPSKVTLTKNSKKEDFGIVLGCKLFIKEISSKARDQLANTNQLLCEGDFITKINNTNCNDLMSLKEAKKIIDSTKDVLTITINREFGALTPSLNHHQTQSSISTTGAVNNLHKCDDFLTSPSSLVHHHQSYSNQNLYVQPPTRNPNLNTNGFDDKLDSNSGPNSLIDDKSNLTPRGAGSRSRGPLTEANLNQLERGSYGKSKTREEPPRPPPPRAEDYYSTNGGGSKRQQIYEDDPIVQKNKQPIPDARFITFLKEGSVGIRLTGGNFVGIFVTAVQPGSPASLQGLQPGDKILKVNDMDMNGVTREEAVLFLLGLQDRIELIVQFCKEEYDNCVASQKGDSFYIKTHFHYDNPAKGEMSFRSGDVFHVIDTLYNGVVGCWQVFRIGRNNQEVQKGIIPNKSRAEELATAQFNATKKEMSASESRGSFFKRRRSSNRRSKSLGKEHWDDILFSDTVSKFPAYERVLLKHPSFTRPVILFGPIADLSRQKLLADFPDKFISPQLDPTITSEDTKSQKPSNIIRLSAIRDVISTGKHALLDITPNAVERLNYAQMYPIVVFFKAETKMVIKQLRQGLPKSAHKSSKKLLEQCQKLDKVWSHIFSATITLTDNTDNWYRKVREIIDKQQSAALWISESKPEESLSDDFLFPMSSLRLSYASSPESDLEHSPGPPVSHHHHHHHQQHHRHQQQGSPTAGRLTKASSDPSVVMPPASDCATDTLPPYQPNYDSRYGFNQQQSQLTKDANFALSNQDLTISQNVLQHVRQGSTLLGPAYHHHKGHSTSSEQSPSKDVYGQVPDLPPRIDRAIKPLGLITTPSKIPNGRSAHERLFGTKPPHDNAGDVNDNFNNKINSLERNQNSKSDSLSSYDSFNKQSNQRIGPNAHDDLKTTLSKIDSPHQGSPQRQQPQQQQQQQQRWEHSVGPHGSKLDLKYGLPQPSDDLDKDIAGNNNDYHGGPPRTSDIYRYSRSPAKKIETKTDYGKYSRNIQDYNRNSHQDLSSSHQSPNTTLHHHHSPMKNGYDVVGSSGAAPQPPLSPTLNTNNGYKPIPPPKPKNYKPPYKNQQYEGLINSTQMGAALQSQHGKSYSNPVDQRNNYYYNMMPPPPPPQNSWHTETAVRFNTNIHGHYDMAPTTTFETRRHPGISYASRSEIQPIASHENYEISGDEMTTRSPERGNIVDLQGSREQRGSAFELYRKPMHHNLRVDGMFGSQPNVEKLTNSPKIKPKLTKTQSFRHENNRPKSLFRKFSFKKSKPPSPSASENSTNSHLAVVHPHQHQQISVANNDFMRASKRDITTAIVDHNGGILINDYWGVSLEVPAGAIQLGQQKEIYFVISDPRLSCDVPPLDLENGETMLSPLVMCGPQGTQFLKPVILNIPHYANTLPSLGISLKATDSEQDVQTDWDNILLPSNHAANSVAVKVDHF